MISIDLLLADLVRIPSINPSLAGDGLNNETNESRLAIFVRDWLASHNIKALIEEVEPGRPNVYAETGSGDGPILCLAAHLDTVGVQEMTIPPFTPTIEGNGLYGRGSCDMKGGLAAVLMAAVAISKQKIKGKLILALVCDEEFASIGADDFVKRHRADACILTEPSDLKLVIGHKGFLWGTVITHGKSAHGSRYDIGVSAISKMGPILTGLSNFDSSVLRARVDPLVGPASMHVSLINGGSGVSTYASSCTIHIERRTLPSEKLAAVKEELESIIHASDPAAKVEWYFDRPPFYCDPHSPIVAAVKQAYEKQTKSQATLVGWGVWTDAAIFQQAGIPTVNIGPSGFGLHEPVEWVDLDSVRKTANIIIDAAIAFLK